MKQTLFTFLLIFAIGLASCRKDKIQPTIKQYDNQQILNYITVHGLTGMKRDTIGGDTSGIYYQVLNPGTSSINGTPVTPLTYSSQIMFVYTLKTFDASYTSVDTIQNHYFDYVGHVATPNKLPLGLQTAILNELKYPDASIRVLIPSHLAYGINGTGSGSSQVANNRIAGNECLDYYVHAVNNFQTYDDQCIKTYMADSGFTVGLKGYTAVKVPVQQPISPLVYWPGKYAKPFVPDSGTYYYKIDSVATGTDPITINSTITANYTGQLFDATLFDSGFNGPNIATQDINSFAVYALVDAFEKYASTGTKISILIPSSLGYQLAPQANIPAFSCMRFTYTVLSVTP